MGAVKVETKKKKKKKATSEVKRGGTDGEGKRKEAMHIVREMLKERCTHTHFLFSSVM
jgi:hypothetical protein